MLRSPTLLAPGTGFVEDSISTDRGRSGGRFQDDSNTLHSSSPAAVRLVPNSACTSTGSWPGGWGPL